MVSVGGAAFTRIATGRITADWPVGVIVIVAVRVSPGTALFVVAAAEAVKVTPATPLMVMPFPFPEVVSQPVPESPPAMPSGVVLLLTATVKASGNPLLETTVSDKTGAAVVAK